MSIANPSLPRVENRDCASPYRDSHADSPTEDRDFGPSTERSVADGQAEGPRVTAELGVRSISVDAQPLLDRAIDGLQVALETGLVDAYDLFVTGESFVPVGPAARTVAGRELSTRIADVRDWASKAGATAAPYFQHEPVDCRLSDERYTVVRFPTLCPTEYHDGELVDALDRIEMLEGSDSERIALSPTE